MNLTRHDFASLRWEMHPASPLIHAPWPSPIIADPTFLLPHETPDGRWRLFAHSLLGLHHYDSPDGLAWQRRQTMLRGGLRPFLYREGEVFYLLYERIRHGRFPFFWLPGRRWQSAIEMRQSLDLTTWSVPTVLIEPTLAWHTHPRLGSAVSNPCLVRSGSEYLLYYSAGLVFLPDCGFNEPAYIGVARSDRLTGPYQPLPDPLLAPLTADPWRNLGAGALKVIQVADGWVGFQNGIYWQGQMKSGRSGSALLLLTSPDGMAWQRAHAEPLLRPNQDIPWMRSHVYALDVRRRPDDGRFWLYFNARSDWRWQRGRESIGLLISAAP